MSLPASWQVGTRQPRRLGSPSFVSRTWLTAHLSTVPRLDGPYFRASRSFGHFACTTCAHTIMITVGDVDDDVYEGG